MATLVYTLKDYDNIVFSNTLCEWELPDNTMKIIGELDALFQNHKQNTTTTSHNQSHFNHYDKPRKKKRDYGDNWGKDRIPSAPIKEKKSELEESTSSLRTFMNKLSENNFVITCEKVMSVLETFKDDESTYEKLLAIIFEISGNNKFFSVIYSKLHKHIQQNTTNSVLYTSKLENFVENYKASYQTIQYVDQNDDYDKFCEYNKSNDLRKSKALFCMNLTKQNLLTVTEFTTIVLDIIDKLMNYIELSERSNEVEELTENLFLLLDKEFICVIKTEEEHYSPILEKLQQIGKYKMKEKPGLPTRSIFKYRTMLEYIV